NARAERAEADFENYVREPVREEQMRQLRARVEDNFHQKYGGVFIEEPEKKEAFIRDMMQDQMEKRAMAQQLQARHNRDVDDSLQRACDEDPSLAQVYQDITNADPRSARMRGLASDIINAGDRAGEVLASVRDDPSIRAMRRADSAPFMPQSYRRPGPSR